MNQGKTNTQLKALLDKVRASIHSTYFRMPAAFAQSRSRDQLAPVPGQEREDEQEEALDLAVVATRLRQGDYYRNKDMMRADLDRMVSRNSYRIDCIYLCSSPINAYRCMLR